MAMDVAIIGAGIFGLTAAWACRRAGLPVRIYDAQGPGAGSSGGVVGALSPHMPEAWNPKKAFQLEALLRAQDYWRGIEHASGLPSGYGRTGRIIPLHSQRAADMAQTRAQAATELWQGQAEFTLRDSFPGITAAHGVVFETLSARLYPALAVQSLAAALRADGVQILENHPIRDPTTVKADVVILAAGHACPEIWPDLAPILRGVKGQAALLDHVLPSDHPVLFDDGLYIIGHGTHGTAVGSTSENTWSKPGPDHLLDDLLVRAAVIMPPLAGASVKQRWSGIRPRSSRPDPVLGLVTDRLWLFTGGFKIGFGIAHHLADALVQEITGHTADIPESFRLGQHLSKGARP